MHLGLALRTGVQFREDPPVPLQCVHHIAYVIDAAVVGVVMVQVAACIGTKAFIRAANDLFTTFRTSLLLSPWHNAKVLPARDLIARYLPYVTCGSYHGDITVLQCMWHLLRIGRCVHRSLAEGGTSPDHARP